jgi:hypothetical protein
MGERLRRPCAHEPSTSNMFVGLLTGYPASPQVIAGVVSHVAGGRKILCYVS